MSFRARFQPFVRRCNVRHMSVQPGSPLPSSTPQARKKVTIQGLQKLRRSDTPITMITAYDYPTARALSSNPDVDIVLVGDSLAQVCLGYQSTNELSLNEMIHHTAAVSRGTAHPFLIADMPFGSFHTSVEDATRNAIRLVREGHAEGVKMEGGREIVDAVKRLTEIGIPVCAHIGLQPQRHVSLSGYKVQGKDVDSAERVLKDALALEAAGAFAMVIEAVPQELGKFITETVSVPTIGIGAGKWTNGQVLVWDDIMGTWSGHKAKFVRQFADVASERGLGIQKYTEAVRQRTFPTDDSESYTMDSARWESFLSRVNGS